MRIHPLKASALLLFFFLMTNGALAALIVYEGFNYTSGTTVSGQNGGDGWTNAWTGGAAGNFIGTNVAGSLTYTDINGVSLQTNGGSLVVGNPAGNSTTTATPNRVLNNNLSGGATTTAGPGGTVWIAFLYQRLNFALGTLPFLRQANFGLFEGSGERADVGAPNTTATVNNMLSVWGNGAHTQAAPFQAANFPIQPGVTYFVLIKAVTDGTAAADTAYVWFNWTNLLAEPDISTATIVQNEVNLSSVNTLRFQAGNLNSSGSNACFQVDELRVGTTFTDVAPAVGSLVGPSITLQPADQIATVGTTATFHLTATGSLPLHYQWYFNTNTPVGSDTNVLALSLVSSNDAGNYFVLVSNSVGSITSSVATLTVVPPVLPSIATQPSSQTVIIGDPATFAVGASGTAPLSYQWYFNSNTLGQTTAAFTILNASTNDAGSYFVIVTNLYGAATSSIVTLTVIPPFERLPAFSGADGGARYASGGRGGIVYHVTQLDRNYSDASAGTLRYGLTDANFPPGTPRTIVFDVAGTFWLGRYGAERPEYDNGWDTQSRYNFPNNVTIAGQTAPGPVIIMGGTTKPGGNNIIARNITFAAGYGMKSFNEPDAVPPKIPTVGDFPDSFVYDALDISGQNVMLDHLTTIYGTDETISCNELAANLTVQYCNIAQGQNYPQADAENPGVYTGHALGSLLQAGSNAKISIINNLYAHLKGRLPRVGTEVGTGAFNDFRNNIFYNWFGTAGTGASGQNSFNNFLNNFYLAGPGGDDVSGTNITTGNSGGTGIFSGISSSATRAYVSGNVKDTDKNGNPTNISSADANFTTITAPASAYSVNIGVTLSAPAAFTNTLRYVGARWWARPYDFTLGNTNAISTNDIALYIDERLIKETVTGTGKIIAWADDPFNTNATEGVEWKRLLALRADPVTGAAPFNRAGNWDSDGDGMPDTWEIEHGLDPNVPNNNGDFDHDGYTDLEEYLNDVAAWPAPGVITFINATNNRYAEIYNWLVSGATVNIGGTNGVTFSKWQPSRYDTAFISNATCFVDAVGQHAGILELAASATLNITNGWLNVADKMKIGAGCTVAVQFSGALKVTNSIINNGVLRLTGSAGLTAGSITNNGLLDIMTWGGTLPPNFVNNGVVLDYSLVKVGSASMNGTNFIVTIQGYTGHNYQLQYRDDLVSDTWHDVGPAIPGNDAPINLSHTDGAGAQKRFYRVAVSP
jgi:hypothetical protein